MSEELDRDLLRRCALGWRLACKEIPLGVDLDRDLALSEGDSWSELARVEDIDAHNQSLAVGLATGRGADLFIADFGFDGLNALAKETEPVMVRERVSVSISARSSGTRTWEGG